MNAERACWLVLLGVHTSMSRSKLFTLLVLSHWLSVCPQVLLLPLGIPAILAGGSEVWRVPTTTDVGNVTWGQQSQIIKYYPSQVLLYENSCNQDQSCVML